MDQNIKWLQKKKKQKETTNNDQHIKMMIQDQKTMK